MTTQYTTPLMPQGRSRLLTRLRTIRAAGLAASLLAGCAQTALIVLVTAILTIGLDYGLRLPGPLRLVLGIALLAVSAAAMYRFVLRSLRLPTLVHIARQVQFDGQAAADALPAGVEFALSDAHGAASRHPTAGNPLVAQTIALAAVMADDLAPLTLVRWRWLLAWLASITLAAAVLLVTWPSAGWWIDRGLQRLSWPIVEGHWPRVFEMTTPFAGREILTPPAEPVTLQATITSGRDDVPAYIVLAEPGYRRRLQMTDAGRGLRTITIRPIRSATFWFEAGDADTAASPSRINIVPRPRVTACPHYGAAASLHRPVRQPICAWQFAGVRAGGQSDRPAAGYQ